jgi:hypothetical protein
MSLGTGHVNYLDRSELEYEVVVRGYGDATEKRMEDLRSILRKFLKNGTPGSLKGISTLKEEDEILVCQQKLTEIEKMLGLLALPSSGTDVAKLKRKLEAILYHTSDRIKRIASAIQGQPEAEIAIGHCIEKFLKLTKDSTQTWDSDKSESSLSGAEGGIGTKKKIMESNLYSDSKLTNVLNSGDSETAHDFQRKNKKMRNSSTMKKHQKKISSSGTDSDSGKEAKKKKSPYKKKKSRKTSTSSTDTVGEENKKNWKLKRTPVRYWNLKFSGDDNTSVGAFLADVEDRRVANNMSFRELFQVAGELFTGSALAVYRSCRGRVEDWHGLEVKLRSAFQDPDYDRRLLREIENRKQGADETITVYIAKMRSLFSRLTKPKSELDMLEIIEENVLPGYQASLSLQNYDTLDKLENILQRLERGHLRAQRFESRPTRTVLEPDLAYKPKIRREQNIKISTTETSRGSFNNGKTTAHRPNSYVCWNCRMRGHHYSDCREPRSVFCYGCGRENTVKSKCISCRNVVPGQDSENFSAERRQSGPRFANNDTQTNQDRTSGNLQTHPPA